MASVDGASLISFSVFLDVLVRRLVIGLRAASAAFSDNKRIGPTAD